MGLEKSFLIGSRCCCRFDAVPEVGVCAFETSHRVEQRGRRGGWQTRATAANSWRQRCRRQHHQIYSAQRMLKCLRAIHVTARASSVGIHSSSLRRQHHLRGGLVETHLHCFCIAIKINIVPIIIKKPTSDLFLVLRSLRRMGMTDIFSAQNRR